MLTHPTIDQLRALRLDGMADAFVELQAQDHAPGSDHAEWLALLLDREAANRGTKRFQSRLRTRQAASRPGVDRGRRLPNPAPARQGPVPAARRRPLDRRAPQSARHRAVRRRQVVAPCALAQKACRDGYTVHYARVPRLFADLELAHGDGRFARLFRTLVKADLLILDDWGPDRLSANQRRDLMEIVEDRYGAGSTLITSQLPVEHGTTSSASRPSPTPSSIACLHVGGDSDTHIRKGYVDSCSRGGNVARKLSRSRSEYGLGCC